MAKDVKRKVSTLLILSNDPTLTPAEVLRLVGEDSKITGDDEKDARKMVSESAFKEALKSHQRPTASPSVGKSSGQGGPKTRMPTDIDEAVREAANSRQPLEDEDVVRRAKTAVETAGPLVPRGRRRAVVDPEALGWLKAARDADAKIALSDFGKALGNPRLEPHGYLGYKYIDPLDSLLEPEDFKNKDRRNPNYILLSQEQRDRYNRLPWRSREFYRAVERRLNSLWLSVPACSGCGKPIEEGFGGEVKKFLTGKLALPGEEARRDQKNIKPPAFHNVCAHWRHELRDLDLVIQDYDPDDPKTQATRAQFYVDAMARVHAKALEENPHTTRHEVVEAFKDNLRKREEGR